MLVLLITSFDIFTKAKFSKGFEKFEALWEYWKKLD